MSVIATNKSRFICIEDLPAKCVFFFWFAGAKQRTVQLGRDDGARGIYSFGFRRQPE
jgi:hypothetical protein